MRSRDGFTLVEALSVVFLIGILIALAAPNIDVVQYRMNGAVTEVGSTLLAAQRLAVTRQHDVVVRFDEPGRRIIVHWDANNDGVQDADERVQTYPLAEGVVFGRGGAPPRPLGEGPIGFRADGDGLPTVRFHRNGSASEAGVLYLTSERAERSGDRPRDARALELERSTGRPSWYRYSGTAWERAF